MLTKINQYKDELMQKQLKPLLAIQNLDIKMIRLMAIKFQRENEINQIKSIQEELQQQLQTKELDIEQCQKEITTLEQKIQALSDKYKSLEAHQSTVKKVEDFNSLTREMSATEREKQALETTTSNILDKKAAEEELLEKIKETLSSSALNNQELEKEINQSIEQINAEGRILKTERDALATEIDPNTLYLYERLIKNKKDRVIVPIENRTCSGCHIALTVQHENLVRKASSIVYCEHCSRIHYWEEQSSSPETKTRRKRRSTKT